MRCMAEIADIGMTIDKKLRLTLDLQGASLVQLIQLQKDGRLDMTLKKHSDKRSLDANAYYWKLLGELAKALQTSHEELHNQLLDSYGSRTQGQFRRQLFRLDSFVAFKNNLVHDGVFNQIHF